MENVKYLKKNEQIVRIKPVRWRLCRIVMDTKWTVARKSHISLQVVCFQVVCSVPSSSEVKLPPPHSLLSSHPGTDLFSSVAPTDCNVERKHSKPSVANQTSDLISLAGLRRVLSCSIALILHIKAWSFFPLRLHFTLPPSSFFFPHCSPPASKSTLGVFFFTERLAVLKKDEKLQVEGWSGRWIKQDRGAFSMQTSRFYY